ncbi:MAG: ferredoxin reductase family protein [Acidimicrobiales bacterium]
MTAAVRSPRRSGGGTPRYTRPGPAAHLGQSGREGAVAAAVAAGAGLVCLLWWRDNASASVHGLGPWLTSAGRVTGLVGTYLVLVEVLLMSRVAWLDRLVGMDRLAVWHRRNGEYSIGLLLAHAVLTIWGYAVTAHTNVVGETSTVVFSYPDMLAATVGLGLLTLVGVLSARKVRSRVSYHTWYFIHLYTYVALALSFAHQFSTGVDFATHPLNRAVWIAMYALVGALILGYRVGKPVRDTWRHRLRVASVVSEGAGLTSIYLSGDRLDELEPSAGQFFMWRFLTREGWWQAHPFSLSAAPNGQWLRITVKDLGDHTTGLRRLGNGTRVMAEGPYGSFTGARRTRKKVLLIAGGVGITPLRALFESLPGGPGDLSLIYRASSADGVAFGPELEAIASARRCRVHFLLGPTRAHPEYLSARHLLRLVPDVARRDVFLCGPPDMAQATMWALHQLDVPRRHIHRENFEL